MSAGVRGIALQHCQGRHPEDVPIVRDVDEHIGAVPEVVPRPVLRATVLTMKSEPRAHILKSFTQVYGSNLRFTAFHRLTAITAVTAAALSTDAAASVTTVAAFHDWA